jgi:hypothetical protein
MRRLVWLPIAGFLLIAGAAVAAAAPGFARDAANLLNGTLAMASPDPSASPAPSNGTTTKTNAQSLLDQVLADMVSQGVITQAQSDAISSALQAKIDDQQAQLQQQRQELQQERTQIQGFLEDGVITQDEIDQLPADSPLRQVFDSIAKDGQVTLDQLRQLGPDFGLMGGPYDFTGPGMGPFRGRGGFGPWGYDQNNDNQNNSATPSPSPSVTTTSS